MTAPSKLYTSEDLWRRWGKTHKRYELVRGRLVELMPTSFPHGDTVGEIVMVLRLWNRAARAGYVVTEAGYTLQRNPDTVRGPDARYVARGRVSRKAVRRGFLDLVPDFVVEVRPPNDSWPEMRALMEQYLEVGVRLAWLVEIGQFVDVYRPGQPGQRSLPDDDLSGEDVLPGFSCRVRDLFPPDDYD